MNVRRPERRSPALRGFKTSSYRVDLGAAGVCAAVSARVARARSDHPASALCALDCVFPRVEQGGLARWWGVERLRRRLRARGAVALRSAGFHLWRQDPDLLLLIRREELLAHPPEHVVDDRLRDSDVRIVRLAARLEAHVRELRDIDLERNAVLEAQRDRDHERVHEARQGRALLGDVHEDVARGAVLVEADVDVALVVADAELAADLDPVLG